MSLLKETSLYSIFTSKCPSCHQEKMYTHSNPYNLKYILTMHEKCSSCNTKYQLEPSFFYGAMYVSYGVGVALGIIVFILSSIVFKMSLLTSFFLIMGAIIGLLPIVLRLSRNIWINIFLSYDSSKASVQKN